ncbi:MAG TPA: ABC transporter ATP-binding protein [Candidatus Sulfotelmatobacter sp.]|nr:ABC transporter ATP-binding protein [Candidatus Sulfotelmatobacter sp.]
MVLRVRDLVAGYGQSTVVQGISLAVEAGEVVSLLGRNGAGKTTTLRAIMGLNPPRSGQVTFKDGEIGGRPPFAIARLGIGYVPDDRRIFPDLTVQENLELARRMSGRSGRWDVGRVCDLFPVLKDLLGQKGSHLSGGEQKMLAIGRALMQDPELLLLDEPIEGLAPLVVAHLGEALRRIREAGVTILLADQNVKFCRRVADRAYILEKGMVQFEGTMAAVFENEALLSKYLAV